MGEEDGMKPSHHLPKRIARKLREAGWLLDEGTKMVRVCKRREMPEARTTDGVASSGV